MSASTNAVYCRRPLARVRRQGARRPRVNSTFETWYLLRSKRGICYAPSVVSANPFVFQRPVDDLIDREAELQRLLDLAAGAHFMRLSAPRRYGKTTLIRRLRIEAES